MIRTICFIVLIGLVAAGGVESGGDLGTTSRQSINLPGSDFAEDLTENASTTNNGRRMFGSRDAEDLVAWRGRIDPKNGRSYFAASVAVNKCDNGQNCNSNLGKYPYENYINDPTGDSGQPVLKISYPRGSWSPGSPKPGGTLFFAYPYKANPTSKDNPLSAQSATLEYEVYFPPDFDFVKGGKLPGMAGGNKNGRGCGGGVDPNECFSYRVMWRREGHGEAYIYAKEGGQGPDFCSKYPDCSENKFPCTLCNYNHGVSFARGSFKFQTGQWQKIRISITLNDPGTANGYLGLEYNGELVASYDKMMWRAKGDMKIEAAEISSWFGGSDDTWSPPKDTFVLLRNIKIYRTGPATAYIGSGRSAVVTSGPTEQTVVEEVMDVAPW